MKSIYPEITLWDSENPATGQHHFDLTGILVWKMRYSPAFTNLLWKMLSNLAFSFPRFLPHSISIHEEIKYTAFHFLQDNGPGLAQLFTRSSREKILSLEDGSHHIGLIMHGSDWISLSRSLYASLKWSKEGPAVQLAFLMTLQRRHTYPTR